MKTEELVRRVDDLFAGRRDTYAFQTEINDGKAKYASRTAPLTPEVLYKHLKGEQAIAIFPIVDGKVKWGAIDIDAEKIPGTHTPVDGAWEISWKKALEQKAALSKAGIHSYIERSRSGFGAHVWIFLDDWMDAASLRRLLLSVITLEKTTPELVYPVQDGSTTKLGNHLALPFFGLEVPRGNSTFLDDSGIPIGPKDFVVSCKENSVMVLEELAEEAEASARPSISLEKLRPEQGLTGALKLISTYGCKFMHHAWENRKSLPEPQWYVALQQATCFKYGREFAHALSRDYDKYSKHETNAKYDQALRNPPAGCEYIRQHFPGLACTNCPGKAPYQTATLPLSKLIFSSSEDVERVGSFDDDLMLIKGYNDGTISSGIDWGVPLISSHNKLRNSELTVIGGFPSLGKTWFMLANAIQIARRGIPVILFSAETAREQLRLRILSAAAYVDLTALKGGRGFPLNHSEWAALKKANEELKTLPLYTDYTSMNPEKVLEKIEEVLLRDNIPLDSPYVVFFDYLQFAAIEESVESERERISKIAQGFKFIAKVTNHPAVLFSQLKRDKDSSASDDEDSQEKPELHWLGGSSTIERSGDVIFFITGRRTGGLYASRKLYKMKDRDGEAPKEDTFILHKAYGEWTTPHNRRLEELPETESLIRAFNGE